MSIADVIVSLGAVVAVLLLVVGIVQTVQWVYEVVSEMLDGSAGEID